MSHVTADRVEFVRRSWPAHARQLAPIRAEIRRWLVPLDLSDDAEQAFVVAVNEAAGNAVKHAYAPATTDDVVELTFWTEDQTVCFEIVDHGRWQPPAAISSSRRRGFAIMSELMQAVLVHYDIRGTRVLLRQAV
jgi:serine/threonine-protein kinase RsbW